jgi:hypothetical protein
MSTEDITELKNRISAIEHYLNRPRRQPQQPKRSFEERVLEKYPNCSVADMEILHKLVGETVSLIKHLRVEDMIKIGVSRKEAVRIMNFLNNPLSCYDLCCCVS